MKCVETAWGAYRQELMRSFRRKLGEEGQAEDLLQDVFPTESLISYGSGN